MNNEFYVSYLGFSIPTQDNFEKIIDRPLKVEAIDTYAEDALTELIQSIGALTTAYSKFPTITGNNGREEETLALKFFGIDSNLVETSLDYIAEQDKFIKNLGGIITKAAMTSESVIVPTEPSEKHAIISGGSGFEKADNLPKLKTLLYIVSNETDIDLEDPEQLKITEGVLKDSMIRKETYKLVELPSINRTYLICDEDRNITFTFDNDRLSELDITPSDLIYLTKKDINYLLKIKTTLGKRINHNAEFENNLAASISDDFFGNNKTMKKPRKNYLNPEIVAVASEGELSVYGIAKSLDISRLPVKKIIKELSEELGQDISIGKRIFGNRTADAYNEATVELIVERLNKTEILTPKKSETEYTQKDLAKVFNVDPATIAKVLKELEEELECNISIGKRKIGSVTTDIYDEQTKEMVSRRMEKKGFFTSEAAEGEFSLNSMAAYLEIDPKTTKKVITEMSEELGTSISIGKRKFNGSVANAYSQATAEEIRSRLETKGLLSSKIAENEYSIFGIAKAVGADNKVVKKEIDKIAEELGKDISSGKRNTGCKITDAYSEEVKELVRSRLEARGYFTQKTKKISLQ